MHGIYTDRIGTVDFSIPVNKWVGLKAIVRNVDGGDKVGIDGYVDEIAEEKMIDGSNSNNEDNGKRFSTL